MEFQIDKNSFSYEKYSEKFGNPGSSRKNEDAFLNRFLKEFDKKISQIQENVELKTRASTLRSSNTFGKGKQRKIQLKKSRGRRGGRMDGRGNSKPLKMIRKEAGCGLVIKKTKVKPTGKAMGISGMSP